MVEDVHMSLTSVFKRAVKHRLKQTGRSKVKTMGSGLPTGEETNNK